jgi:hypothetical protein
METLILHTNIPESQTMKLSKVNSALFVKQLKQALYLFQDMVM